MQVWKITEVAPSPALPDEREAKLRCERVLSLCLPLSPSLLSLPHRVLPAPLPPRLPPPRAPLTPGFPLSCISAPLPPTNAPHPLCSSMIFPLLPPPHLCGELELLVLSMEELVAMVTVVMWMATELGMNSI